MERALSDSQESGAEFRLDTWLIQPALSRFSGPQGTVHVRPLLMDLLVLLARNAGHVVSKEEINQAIWGRRFLAESGLTRLVAELRRALGDDAEKPRFIENVPKRGYRLVASIAPDDAHPPSREKRLSVAVLPFADMAREKDHEYFCDGLAEELTNALARLRGLRVIARTSAFAFKGKAVDIREIGRQLGVDAVVEGSVQRAEGRLRVTVQLINAADGSHLWSERFDRPAADFFSIEDEIAQAVVGGLKVRLLSEEEARLSARRSRAPEAHDLYLLGRHLLGTRIPEKVAKAIECFRGAIDIDPGYAPAWAALSECYCSSAFLGFLPPGDAYPAAKQTALKALEIDSSLAEAHAMVGFVAGTYEWDWSEALRHFRHAGELVPSNALACNWHAIVLCAMGRLDEARAEIERGWDLDPLSPLMQANLGCILLHARRYEAAIERCLRALEISPGFVLANFHLGRTYAIMGRPEEGVVPLEQAAPGFPMAMSQLGRTWVLLGRRDKAEAILGELERMAANRYVGALNFAIVRGSLYGLDSAIDWLSRAFDAREGALAIANVDPGFDWMRSDTTVQDLLQRLRLLPA